MSGCGLAEDEGMWAAEGLEWEGGWRGPNNDVSEVFRCHVCPTFIPNSDGFSHSP